MIIKGFYLTIGAILALAAVLLAIAVIHLTLAGIIGIIQFAIDALGGVFKKK